MEQIGLEHYMAALRDSLGDTRLCRPEAGRIKEHDHRRPLSTPAWGVATSVVLGPSGVSIWINVVAMSTVSLFRPHPDTSSASARLPGVQARVYSAGSGDGAGAQIADRPYGPAQPSSGGS
jgi:hypothetical protein